MMRWNSGEMTKITEPSEHRDPIPAQFLLDAVVLFVARLGTRSAVLVVMVALILTALLLGLTADDTMAGGRWCPGCR